MRTPFVLVDATLVGVAEGDRVALGEDRVHHLRRVLRRGDGDPLVLTDGGGRTAAAVLDGATARTTAAVEEIARRAPAIHVVHALPKGRGFDEVVRTLTELGVAGIRPVMSARTEVRLDRSKAETAAERWRAVARSAAEQALNAHLPQIATPRQLDVTDSGLGENDLGIVADPAAGIALGDHLDRAHGRARTTRQVHLLVGPEGGLAPEEIAEHVAHGWVAVRAGPTVLRSVHAGAALAAAVMALTGHYTASA